jgi:hypothetical protein
MLASGGVIPFVSFVMEAIVARDVKRYLAEREAADLTTTEAAEAPASAPAVSARDSAQPAPAPEGTR